MSKLQLLESFDSGSNYRFGDKMNKPNNPRSLFDLGFTNTLTIDNGGLLVPIGLMQTIPGDDFQVKVDSLLRVMPQVVPLMSRQRMYIYGFWSRYSDLWNNWQVFIDRGYTGNVQKIVPQLANPAISFKRNVHIGTGSGTSQTVKPNTLMDYIGLPIGASFASLFGNTTSGVVHAGISVLPWMMYLRIYRDYFMNKDEWIQDRVMLPDDDSRFRVNDDGELLSAKDISKKFYFGSNYDSEQYDINISGDNYYLGLLYHDYPDDYFTSAKPFTQRGTAEGIKKEIDTSAMGLDFSSSGFSAITGDVSENNHLYGNTDSATIGSPFKFKNDVQQGNFESLLKTQLQKGKITGSNVYIKISIEDIRKAAIEQNELYKMALCDGSYAQFGLTFFGEVSKAAHDFRPVFFGGVYKSIAFTEVLQNSPQVPISESENTTPLGTFAGHGIAGMNNNFLGSLHCDDYGLIMFIACIMPDIYYHQGLKRIFTDSLETDFFKPDRAKLGMQPIYNKELYYAGNNGSSSGQDNYLWAYQNPFDYLRYNQNEIHGKIADTTNKSFYPFTQARKFNSLVNWGRNFSEAKDIRKDYLASSSESAYILQTKFDIRCVRELPYKAIPAPII